MPGKPKLGGGRTSMEAIVEAMLEAGGGRPGGLEAGDTEEADRSGEEDEAPAAARDCCC